MHFRGAHCGTTPISLALVAALGAADAAILVDMDDIAAHAAGNVAELALLVGRRLLKKDVMWTTGHFIGVLKQYFGRVYSYTP